MIQRAELLTIGFSENQLSAIEDDLVLNISKMLFNTNKYIFRSFTPNGSGYYAFVKLPDTVIEISNAIATDTDDDEFSINDTVTLASANPQDTDPFLFSWYGNGIIVDNGSDASEIVMRMRYIEKSLTYLSEEVLRDFYSLFKSLYMEDGALIFSAIQRLHKSSKNKVLEHTEIKPATRRRRINIKPYRL